MRLTSQPERSPQSAPALALSTSWNARGQTSGAALVADVAAAGFRRIELSYVPAGFEADVAAALRDHAVQVASLHNPYPVPLGESGTAVRPAEVEWLASLDRRRWHTALDGARRTIETAAQFGALGVVLHLGCVDVPNRQRELMALRRERGPDDPAFLERRGAAWAERQARAAPHVERAIEALRLLGEAARGAAVTLGVETRDGYHEIPSAEEFETVLGAVEGLPVGYWHDVGHAAKQEFLGYLSARTLLRRWGPAMVGIHLHDCVEGRDHLALGEGTVDFAPIAAAVPAGALRTLELGPGIPVAGVHRSRAALARHGL